MTLQTWRVRVRKAERPTNLDPLTMHPGDRVEITGTAEDGWVWCRNGVGKEDWVLLSFSCLAPHAVDFSHFGLVRSDSHRQRPPLMGREHALAVTLMNQGQTNDTGRMFLDARACLYWNVPVAVNHTCTVPMKPPALKDVAPVSVH